MATTISGDTGVSQIQDGVVTPADLTLAASSIGVGQTWQSVTRPQDTDFTNNTGKPIMLKMFGTASTAGMYFVVTVGGFPMNYAANVGTLSTYATFTILIPSGATYRWTPIGGTLVSIDAAELR